MDFAEIEQYQSDGDWNGGAVILGDAVTQVVMAGANCVAICTNTTHLVFVQICDGINVTCLHTGDALGEFASRNDYLCLGLLGTRFTMKESFLSDRLRRRFGIEVIIPVQVQRQAVHRIIYEELCHGELNDSSRDVFLDVVEDLSHEVVLRSFSDVSKLSYSSTEAIRNYLCLIQQRFKRKPWLISRYVFRS